MTGKTDASPGGISRRDLLGAVAGVGAGASAGCLQDVGGLLGGSAPGQLSLTVKTMPADADTVATMIGRRLVKHLRTAGVDAKLELQPPIELRRDVLINGSFELYIGRYPDREDPDFLRPLLHSVFGGEGGWQNPFEFTDIKIDKLLTAQEAATGTQRKLTVNELQREIASKQPFGVIGFPDEIWGARTDRYLGWEHYPPTNPICYVALGTRDGVRNDDLRVTTTDAAPTKNLNPLAVQQRSRDIFTGLLYDRIGRRVNGEITPWLAEDVRWDRRDGTTVGEVRLRDDLRWHDGEALTAEDVAFTYRFLEDTLLGNGDAPAPSLRFRGRASLVDDVDVETDRTLTLRCPDASPEVARRALDVPVLPAHIWVEHAVKASVAWSNGSTTLTQAMVWPNTQPVGSGPVQFEGRAKGESLVLTRYDDHFLHRDTANGLPSLLADGVPFDRLSVRITPSDQAAIQLMSADEADATAMRISPGTVPRIGEDDSLTLHVEPGRSFYHIGFNTRQEPLGNPHVRRAIIQLLDKENIVHNIFDGYARPAASPMSGTGWLAPSLTWDGSDPEVPFAGEDGTLDESQARDLFREAGLEYSDEGRLLDR